MVIPSAHRQIVLQQPGHEVEVLDRSHAVEAVRADFKETLVVRQPDLQAWGRNVLRFDIMVSLC